MLSHKVMTGGDIGQTASYYEDGVDDYYAKEGEASQWQGIGAERLGLTGEVDSKTFRELLAGNINGQSITSRDSTRIDSKKRLGIDLTFSPPKSVSIQALVGGDAEIIKAHDKAVTKALEVVETMAQARVKENGISRVEDTGNLIVAKFRHETSREQDPQLHTHAFVMNLTQREDGNWRALKNDNIIKSTRYLDSIYTNELAKGLKELGYDLRFEREGSFELSHISREQIEGMSQRRMQIVEALKEKGLDVNTASTGQKQKATLETRNKKESIDRTKLFESWKDKASELGIKFERKEWAGIGAKHSKDNAGKNIAGRSYQLKEPADEIAKKAVRYAVNHVTERQSVINHGELLDIALKHSVGHTQLKNITDEVNKQVKEGFLVQEQPIYKPAGLDPRNQEKGKTREEWIQDLVDKNNFNKDVARERVDKAILKGGLIPGETRYTTQTAIEREKGILKIEREGRGAVPSIMEKTSAIENLSHTNLNHGQKEAALLIATSQDRVIGVQGFAGVGKSHMLDTAKKMVEDQNYNVRALAPYSMQVKALQELNVKANTLASFLKAKDKEIDSKTVIVIDEAGTVPTRQMQQVLQIAEKAGARVVLMGDTAQTKAIEAGRPFAQLQDAGMKTATIDEIQRQVNPELKKAVEFAAKGDTEKSLQHIQDIVEIKGDSERRLEVAKAYTSLEINDRDKTIIVSGTNEARREINEHVREQLGLKGNGTNVEMLVRRDTTQAERKFSKNYNIGDVIQPERSYKNGLERGELYTVADTGPGNRLTVQSQKDGSIIQYNPMRSGKISVYEQEKNEITKGDLVRITRNDAKLDIANGDRFTVQNINDKAVTLTNGERTIELSTKEPVHLGHAYATTVHSSQGLTSDRVIIDADSHSRTTAKDVYYVAISRARNISKIFTNDVEKLPKSIARENIKFNAQDLALGKNQIKGNEKTIEKGIESKGIENKIEPKGHEKAIEKGIESKDNELVIESKIEPKGPEMATEIALPERFNNDWEPTAPPGYDDGWEPTPPPAYDNDWKPTPPPGYETETLSRERRVSPQQRIREAAAMQRRAEKGQTEKEKSITRNYEK